jgi:hypothetical protein
MVWCQPCDGERLGFGGGSLGARGLARGQPSEPAEAMGAKGWKRTGREGQNLRCVREWWWKDGSGERRCWCRCDGLVVPGSVLLSPLLVPVGQGTGFVWCGRKKRPALTGFVCGRTDD